MDTRIIEIRKNILIKQQIANVGETSFNSSITTVNFIPDEVIVKMISFNSADPQANPYNSVVNISTNLIDDQWLGSITDVGSSFPGLTFTLKKPIFGQYKFQLFNVNNVPFNYIGDLSIHLEFVKYGPDKKVY